MTYECNSQSVAAPQPFANNYFVLLLSHCFYQPVRFCDGNKPHMGLPAIECRKQQSQGLGTGGTWVLLLKLLAAASMAEDVSKQIFRVCVCTLLKAAGYYQCSGCCFWLPEDPANTAGHLHALLKG